MSDTYQLKLETQLTIASAEACHLEFEKALHSGQGVSVDGSLVERIDTSGMQLLCSLQSELEKAHQDIQWSATSEALVQTAKLLGVADTLGL